MNKIEFSPNVNIIRVYETNPENSTVSQNQSFDDTKYKKRKRTDTLKMKRETNTDLSEIEHKSKY